MRSTHPLRRVVAVAVAAAALGAVLVQLEIDGAAPGCCRGVYVSLYDRPASNVESVLGRGDGQAFAALAQDPLLRRPEVITPHGEFAYRAQRPAWGYLAWAMSAGDPARVPWALAALTVLSLGFATAALGLLLLDRGANPWFALGLVPLAAATIAELTPELLGLGLAAFGLAAWQRDRTATCAVLLGGAALTRESLLVVPAVLLMTELISARRTAEWAWRRLIALAVPFALFGAWVLVLRFRLGAWPTRSSSNRLSLPLVGFGRALGEWSSPAMSAIGLTVMVVLLIGAVIGAPRDRATWIAIGFAAFATVLGHDVWVAWRSSGRALLPCAAFAFVAVVAAATRGGVERSSDRRPRVQRHGDVEPRKELEPAR
ncbi:MAG TPA: hypothetical protein VIH82_13660 [Acidimicrobiia bacterium]